MTFVPQLLVNGLWVFWLVVWLLAARWTGRTVTRPPLREHFAQTLPTLAGAVLMFAPHRHWPGHYPRFVSADGWYAWAGVLAAAGGVGIAVWARVYLGRFWSSDVTLKADHAVIRSGPYAYVRHPIYAGILLALAGTVLVQGTALALLGFVLVAVGLAIKLKQEERLLAEHLGRAYEAYRAVVPALVPRLW